MANSPKIRSAYDGTRVQVSVAKYDASQTVQDQKDSCDINLILKKYNKTGVIEHANAVEGRYGDFTGMDYQTMLNQVKSAESAFQTLPALERKKFNNDVSEWLDHIQNPDNIADMKDGKIDNEITLDGKPDLQSGEAVEEAPPGA